MRKHYGSTWVVRLTGEDVERAKTIQNNLKEIVGSSATIATAVRYALCQLSKKADKI